MLLLITPAIVLAIGFCILYIAWHARIWYLSSGLKNVSGPPMLPIIGNAIEIGNSKTSLSVLSSYAKKYNGLARVIVGFDFMLVVTDYNFMEKVFSSPMLISKSRQYKFLHNWLGTGLLTSDNPKWKSRRKLITPTYHFKILEQFIDVFDNNTDVMVKKMSESKGCVDVYPFVTLCALDIICETAMGTSVNAQNDSDSEYVRSVKTLCRIQMERVFSPIQSVDFLYPLSSNYYQEKQALKVLHGYTTSIIRKRKAAIEAEEHTPVSETDEFGLKKRTAFLDLLINAHVNGKALSEADIREEVDTFMFEGHDTTASAISFAIHALANNPHVQEKVLAEQREIFGDEPNRKVTIKDLQDMKYLEMVIKETLRMYPSVPLYGREVKEDTQIGEHLVKKGTQIVLFAIGIHYDPKYFPEPDVFRPERFLPENMTGNNPYSFVPFSAGPRNCIGQKFAMLEMKSNLSKVIRKLKLSPAKVRKEMVLVSETILKSASGVFINVDDRIW